MVKVQPPRLGGVTVGWTLTIPQLPLGEFKNVSASFVGWTLTIPQLPLGGLQVQICVDTKATSSWHLWALS